MLRELRDQRRAADRESGLRAAEELVARERDQVRAVGEAIRDGPLPGDAELVERDDATRSLVVHPRDSGFARHRRDFRGLRRGRVAADLVVRRVNRQQERCVGGERAPVVVGGRAVGRADFAKERAGGFEDLGDLETPTDRDELSPGNEDRASARERGESEVDGRSVVVDDERLFRSEERPGRTAHVVLALAAPTGRGLVLDGRVPRGDPGDRVAGSLRQRRPAQVRVQEHAGAIDDADDRRCETPGERLARRADQRVRFRAPGRDRAPQLLFDCLAPVERQRLGSLGPGEERVHRRGPVRAHGRYYRKRCPGNAS